MAATSVVNLTVVASDVSTGASLTDGTDYSLQNPTDIDVVFGQYAVPPNPFVGFLLGPGQWVKFTEENANPLWARSAA